MNNSIVLKNNQCEYADIYTYPDGQRNIKLKLELLNIKRDVEIRCSIRNFGELEVLLCLIAALEKNDFSISCINFIYIFGMRSDRAFETGIPNYWKDVIAPILNNISKKYTLFFNTSHSKLSNKCIFNSK